MIDIVFIKITRIIEFAQVFIIKYLLLLHYI